MYQSFYEHYQDYSMEELKHDFLDDVSMFSEWVDSLSEEELFRQGYRAWTGDRENWPIGRWIHINSIAPFKTFRSKIRKWKKLRG